MAEKFGICVTEYFIGYSHTSYAYQHLAFRTITYLDTLSDIKATSVSRFQTVFEYLNKNYEKGLKITKGESAI